MNPSHEDREIVLRYMLWVIGAAHPDDPVGPPTTREEAAELLGFSAAQLEQITQPKWRRAVR